MPWEVREHGTKKLMGTYSTYLRAVNKKNKFDNDYGGYHYSVIKVDKADAGTSDEEKVKKLYG